MKKQLVNLSNLLPFDKCSGAITTILNSCDWKFGHAIEITNSTSIGQMIAVLNAERHLDSLLPALQRQRLQPDRFLVMDSQSDGSGAERFRVTGVEGRKFVASELRYLANHAPFHIGSALVRIGMKAVGYSLGRRNRFIPASLKRCLSLHRDYWGYDDRSARQN